MSYLSNIGDGLGRLFTLMAIGLIISVPLAIWKFVEIVMWLFTKVEINIK